MMKELWPNIVVLGIVLLSVIQARCKQLRKKTTRSVDTLYHKLEFRYPHRTDVYFRFLTEGPRLPRGNTVETPSNSQERLKRDKLNTEHKRKLGEKISHGSTLLPQPAKPLRVVATSAVIKNRRKKPRPLKAIHIWGPTPFKTVLANLRRLNNKIQNEKGAVKRLFLPVQLQRMQLLNALGKSPLPGRTVPFHPPNGQFPISPGTFHFPEGLQQLPQPLLSDMPGPMQFAPQPFEPVPPLHDSGPLHMQELGPVHDSPPVREAAPGQEIAPMHEMEPANDMRSVHEIEPVPIAPMNGMGPVPIGPMHDMDPVPIAPMNEMGPVPMAPMHEMGPVPDIAPIHDIGPVPQLVSKSFDVAPNMAPNFEPRSSMFVPSFPWVAGEIHEEVNRHIHKGVAKARCSPNPCRNDGTCTAFEKTYECACPIGFMGKNCEDVNHCLPNPCKNEGNCYATKAGYHCTCVKGFKGPNCDIISKCIPNPCKNGGTCEEDGKSYKCSCLPGFKGINCEAADHCATGNPCKNGGTCINGERTFECECLPGFNGADCGDLDVCFSSPCQNSGTCHNTGAGQFMCLCPTLFRGITCEDKVPKCESNPCQNGGTCVEDDRDEEGFHCTCSEKYQGKHCQALRSPCLKNPCFNEGTCIDSQDTFKCICKEGFDGSTCEVKLSVAPLPCTNCHEHANCIDKKCVCNDGYVGNGNVCEVSKDGHVNLTISLIKSHSDIAMPHHSFCHPNPCYNGGTCSETGSGFTCTCPSDYIGLLCKAVKPCLGNPCENEGTCIDEGLSGDFICRCKEGYSGKNCEDAGVCLPNPCQNGGSCHQSHNTYVCQCTERFEGPTCVEDKCAKCDVHAHCENGKCVCDEGFYGDGYRGECFRVGASNPRFCVPNPCQHGGSCFEEPNGHRCLCTSSYQGNSCELSIGAAPPSPRIPDPCTGEPCMNGGSCVSKGTKFNCLCPKGFQGPTCDERAKSYCHPNPCLHGGTCVDDKDGYACKCIGSYRGTNCEVDDCDQCDIHAICVEGACRCRIGYKGDGFECGRIKRCHHCSPNATCINDECVCKPGFIGSGKHCQEDNCKGCPPHSHCLRGICICIPGYYFDGHHCVAAVKKPSATSHCPTECLPHSTCPSTCPNHCCKTTENHAVDSCPNHCSQKCGSECPNHCCNVAPLSSQPICPTECHTSCHQTCPIHCCRVSPLSLTICPSHCKTACNSSCPSHCCILQLTPTVAPTQSTCNPICQTNCLPFCPKVCCNIKMFPLSPCPSQCKEMCASSCPAHCCLPLQLSTQQPPSAQQLCPPTCSSMCKPSCPKFCCKVSLLPPSACPSSCYFNCIPPCPQHCCRQSSPPPSTVVCPSHCAMRCDNSCPSQCCSNKPEQTSFLTQASAGAHNVQMSVSQQSFPTLAITTSCPSFCSPYCTPSCPQYCCKRRQISPYLIKNSEKTVSPIGRSLTGYDADYKSKVVRRLSKLLSSPLRLCQPSCFSSCSGICPSTCCDVRRKKKMYVFKRKKKAQIAKPGNEHRKRAPTKNYIRKISLVY